MKSSEDSTEKERMLGIKFTKKKYFNERFVNVCLLGFSMMLYFSSFNTTQGYMSTLYAEVGYTTLAIIYTCFSLGNFISPTIVGIFGLKISLLAGSIPYAIFIFILAVDIPWILYLSSVLLGVGASILWTAHGEYLTILGNTTELGFYSGVFFGIFQLNLIIGNLITSTLFTSGFPEWLVFVILGVIASVGIFMLIFLDTEVGKEDTVPKRKKISIRGIFSSMKNTLLVLMDIKMVLLCPLILYSGYTLSFFFGKIPEIIGKTPRGKEIIGWVMAVFGVAEFIGSLLFGRGIDAFGKRPFLFFVAGFQLIGIGLSFFLKWYIPYMFFVTAFACGIADSGLNTVIYALVGSLFKNSPSDAFAAYKFVQSMAVSAGLLSSIYLPLIIIQRILIILLCFSVVSFIYLDKKIHAIE